MIQRFNKSFVLSCVLFLLALAATPVFAQQQGPYSLGIKRIFGYNSGDQIRGTISMFVNGPEANIQSVQFMIDGKVVAEITQTPFSVNFITTDYASGYHDLSASIQTKDGPSYDVGVRLDFATAEQESSGVFRIAGPLLGLVLLITLGGAAIQVFFFRGKFKNLPPGTERTYGFQGGSICPRCKRPYSLHVWALNLFGSKFDRCDFCGKWAVVRPLSIDKLRAAERAELESSAPPTPIAEKSEEEKLREMLDKSKYSDH